MSKTNGLIKFAVVGMGHIGKRHAAMVQEHPEAELVAMVDVMPKESLDISDFDVPLFADLGSLLSSDIGVDVVNICTANGMHSAQALEALEHKKHVVVEKPLGLRTSNCEQVISTALNVSRQVFCVMQNRYSPPSLWLKELMDEKRLGDINMVQLNCFWNRGDEYYKGAKWKGTKEMDGGALFTQFSHFIDMMYWLFGDITDINAKFENFSHKESTEFEDSGLVTFKFVNGGVGNLNYSTAVWDSNMESSLIVIGSKGTIKVAGQYMDKVEYCHVENYELPELKQASSKYDYGNYKGSANNHFFVLRNVIETLQGKSNVSTNALEGMKVVNIIERIYSYR
jgi:predicted dehydrogenase